MSGYWSWHGPEEVPYSLWTTRNLRKITMYNKVVSSIDREGSGPDSHQVDEPREEYVNPCRFELIMSDYPDS